MPGCAGFVPRLYRDLLEDCIISLKSRDVGAGHYPCWPGFVVLNFDYPRFDCLTRQTAKTRGEFRSFKFDKYYKQSTHLFVISKKAYVQSRSRKVSNRRPGQVSSPEIYEIIHHDSFWWLQCIWNHEYFPLSNNPRDWESQSYGEKIWFVAILEKNVAAIHVNKFELIPSSHHRSPNMFINVLYAN